MEQNTDILFSILIPAYKLEYIEDAICSVLGQTYYNLELIIVDDCSPENLKSVVDTFSDSRLHYYRNEYNFGAIRVVDNWNKCLKYANGEYVICMGDDDMLAPTCLEDYNNIIKKYPGLNVYHTRTFLIDENSNIWHIQEQRPEFESGYALLWYRWKERGWQYIGDFLYKRSHLIAEGGFFNIPLAWGSDDITAVRAAIPNGIANVDSPGFYYRMNPFTISLSSDERIKAESALIEFAWYAELIDKSESDDDIDKILINLIQKNLNAHFKTKIRLNFQADITANPSHFKFWYKNSEKFFLSKNEVLSAAYYAIKNRTKQNFNDHIGKLFGLINIKNDHL